jgi:putative membrane protein
MKKQILMLLLAAGVFCFQSCGPANTNNADDSVEQAMEQNDNMLDNENASRNNREDDADFAVKAAGSGLAEVNASEVAQEKAQDKRVKDFAAMMVQDHTSVNEELKALAASKNFTLPTAPGEPHLENIADLNSYAGADFDKEYMDLMVDDHQKAVDLFEEAAEDAEDADIRAFAVKTLPSLQKHLDHAKTVRDALE